MLTLGDVEPSREVDRRRNRSRDLGLPADDASALLVDVVTGEPVGVDALPLHLRKARVTGVSVGANSSICRGLLQERYGARSRLASVGGGAEEEL